MIAIIIPLLILVIFVLRYGCCVRRNMSGVLCPHCSSCGCEKCSLCKKKRVCSKCPRTGTGCKCSPCERYNHDLKLAMCVYKKEGLKNDAKGVVKVSKKEASKPVVVKSKKGTKLKVPPPPKCKCPKCPNKPYGTSPHMYYPIYQPLPYGVRY